MSAQIPPRVLALTFSTRGFAFVFFRQVSLPLDWGMKEIRGKQKNGVSRKAITALLDRLLPDIVVLHETDNVRRSSYWNRLDQMISKFAEERGITIIRYTSEAIAQSFGRLYVRTKYDLVQDIVERIPALALRVPPKREAWMNADPRQQLFDAAALAITHEFHRR